MNDQPTPEHDRRRRAAAAELRRRAADLLDQAARLDHDPAMRVLVSDLEKIARYVGVTTDDLVVAVTSLWPRHPDNTDTETS